MKRFLALIFCLCIPLMLVTGCKAQSTDKNDKNLIIYPDEYAERTVGGYKQKETNSSPAQTSDVYYVINTASKKFHVSTCGSAKTINAENRKTSNDRQKLIADGYSPCGTCKP